MQPAPRLRNKTVAWSAKLRPRVGDTVLSNGVYFSNTTGYNGDISDSTIWFPVGNSSSTGLDPITLSAANVLGSDPFYYVDLSGVSGVPALPSNITVYVDKAGDGNFQTIGPIDYNANTKILNGMNSPVDFPSQIIKIFFS